MESACAKAVRKILLKSTPAYRSAKTWELISQRTLPNLILGTYNGSKVIPLGKQTWSMSETSKMQNLKLTRVSCDVIKS